jgi:signal peptidase II
MATPPFWLVVAAIVLADLATKLWAVQALSPRHVPHPIVGDVVRFTLTYNPGAAFGMHLGAYSRWIFAGLSVVIVTLLLRVTRDVVRHSRLAAVGVPVVVGGALGNLVDRIRVRDGVVDFIDIGVGTVRFWTFNLADTAVTIGAACLVVALWRLEDPVGSGTEAPGASTT